MIKNVFIFTFIVLITKINTYALDTPPEVHCDGLPWCTSDWSWNWDVVIKAASNITATIIKFVAVCAVIALMISWIMYMISSWEDEKTKKAKSWIIWSLVAVVLSTSAYYIVEVINNTKIG